MRTTKWMLSLAAAFACTPLFAKDKKADPPVTDAEFVIKAASGGMFEVESSKLAKDQASSPEVKKFAEMMIADHEKANKELMETAKSASVGIPMKMLPTHQKMLDGLRTAKGADFDKAYHMNQKTAHEEAVALFTNASKNLKDPKLKAFAEKTLPTLQSHLDHIKKHDHKGGDKDK